MADDAQARLEKRQELDRLFELRRKKKEAKRAQAKEKAAGAADAEIQAAAAAKVQAEADAVAAVEAAARMKAEAEAAAGLKAQADAAARIRAEAEATARMKAEAEAAARIKAEAEVAARMKAEADTKAAEDAKIKAAAEEAAKKEAEEEAARVQADAAKKAAQIAAKQASDDAAARQEEEEDRIAAEEAEEAEREEAESQAAKKSAAGRLASEKSAKKEASQQAASRRGREATAEIEIDVSSPKGSPKSSKSSRSRSKKSDDPASNDVLKAKILKQAQQRVTKKRAEALSKRHPSKREPEYDSEEEEDEDESEEEQPASKNRKSRSKSRRNDGLDDEFDRLDVNKDGVIDHDEYVQGMSGRGKQASRHQAEESDSEAESEMLEGGEDLSADQVYMMELDQKNAEILLLRQQLVAMGSPAQGQSAARGSSSKKKGARRTAELGGVDSVSPAKRSSRMRHWMCKVHPEEEIRFLSKDTYELLCRDCLLVGAHQGHSYCTIEDAAQDARRVLQTAMDQVLYKERDLTHAVKLLNKSLPSLERQQQFLLESVAKEFGKVQAAVDLRRAEIEHAVLESLRTASGQASGRFNRLQHQQRSLRDACNRAHDALHSYSDMDLLSNAAEIETELEEASNFPAGQSHELAHQNHNPVPAINFNTDALFDEIAQFGVLAMQNGAPIDAEADEPVQATSDDEHAEPPQNFRTPVKRPKSASSTMRGGHSPSIAMAMPGSGPEVLSVQSQQRPSSASGSRRRSYSRASTGLTPNSQPQQRAHGRSPGTSRFKWLTAPVTMTSNKPPMNALQQKRHFQKG